MAEEVEGLGIANNEAKETEVPSSVTEGLQEPDTTEGSEQKESRWRDKVEPQEQSLGLDIPTEGSPEDAVSPPVESPAPGDSPAPDDPPPRPRKKVDPNKPKIKLKVTLIGAANLRPVNHYDEVSTSCACELLDEKTKKPIDGAKFETEVVNDTKHPIWKKEHTWDQSDYTPGDHVKISVKDVNAAESENILGCAELSGKKIYPEGFEGPVELRSSSGEKNEHVGPCAHVRVKIEVEGEEDDRAEQAAKKKTVPFRSQQAQARALMDEGDLTPWAERIAGLTQSTPRVAPGQVLKPKGTPRYERLYQESLLRQGRQQERIEVLEKKKEKEVEESLLKWHRSKDGEWKSHTKEAADEIVTRLYSDAESRKAKLQQKVMMRDEKIASTLQPLHPPAEHDDPNQVIKDSIEKLYGDHKLKLEKLQVKRKDKAEQEVERLKATSIHKNDEGREPDFELYKSLHEDHAKKLQKIAARMADAEQQAYAITRVQLTLPSADLLRNGIRLSILGAKGLSRPEHSLRPEPYVICQIKPGFEVRSRPVTWKKQVSWKEEHDLTDLYDGKGPLRFAVYVDEPDKNEKIHRLLGTAVLEHDQFMASGFEGELILQTPTCLDEDPMFVKLKKLLRTAGYKYGGIQLGKLHRFCDRDGNGKLTFSEFATSVRKDAKLTSEAISDASLLRMFEEIDADGDGGVDFAEFQSWMNGSRKPAVTEQPALSPLSPQIGEPESSPFSPEPDSPPPVPETPGPMEEPMEEKEADVEGDETKKDCKEGDETKDSDESKKDKNLEEVDKQKGSDEDSKGKMLQEDENTQNLDEIAKGKNLQDDDTIKGVDDKLKGKMMEEEQVFAFTLQSEPALASPRSPQEPIPEPSPFVEKTVFGDYLSPSDAKVSPRDAKVSKVAGYLLIKIEILAPAKQGKRAFMESSVNRLYNKHFEVRGKIESLQDTLARRVDEQAYPCLLPSSIPLTPQGQFLEYYHRLYIDAHRRTVDKRIKLKTELKQLQLMQNEENIHRKLLKAKKWEEQDIQAVFERVYQPPTRKIQLHKPVTEESASTSVESEPEVGDSIVEYEPLPPRRMGIFFNRAGMIVEEAASQQQLHEEQSEKHSSPRKTLQPRQSMQGSRGTAPRQTLQGSRTTAPRHTLREVESEELHVTEQGNVGSPHRQALQPRQSLQAGHLAGSRQSMHVLAGSRQSVAPHQNASGADEAVPQKMLQGARKTLQEQPSSARKSLAQPSSATDPHDQFQQRTPKPTARQSLAAFPSEAPKSSRGMLARSSLAPNAFREYSAETQGLSSPRDSRPTTIFNSARRHPGDAPGPGAFSHQSSVGSSSPIVRKSLAHATDSGLQTEAPGTGGPRKSVRNEDQNTSQSDKPKRKTVLFSTTSPPNIVESGSPQPTAQQMKRKTFAGPSMESQALARKSVQSM